MDSSNIFTIIMLALLAWFVYSRFAPVKGLKTLNVQDFKSGMDSSSGRMLIDVREPFEYQSGHIKGAVNIPLSQIRQKIGDIPKDRNLYLYCRSGMRSKQAGSVLSKQGFSNIAHLQGGISVWNGQIVKG